MNATVNVLCYKSKTLSNGENPLMIRVCKDGKKKYISLGVSIKSDYWDFEKNQPKRNCTNREQIQLIISEKIKTYQEQILEYKLENKEFTASSLYSRINKAVKARTVKETFDLYIQRLCDANRIRYASMFTTALNSLIKFNGHMDVYFSDIEIAWLKRYEAWMFGEGLAANLCLPWLRPAF